MGSAVAFERGTSHAAMRILFLLQDFPHPPRNGTHLTPFNLIDYMARRHECFVLCFGGPVEPDRVSEWEGLYERLHVLGTFPVNRGAQLFWKRFVGVMRGEALSCARWASGAFEGALSAALRRHAIDVVHVDMINLTQYAAVLGSTPAVFAMNDASSRLYDQIGNLARGFVRRCKTAVLGWQLRQYEVRMAEKAHCVRLVSAVDAAYLQRLAPRAKIRVIGVTLDKAFFEIPNATADHQRPVVLLGGFMNSPETAAPIIDFVRNHWPTIQAEFPNASLELSARGMDAAYLQRLRDIPGVTIRGWVEDYMQSLAATTVCVYLDSAGTGLKNRVVQAMGAARPVVATAVAFEAIPVIDGISGLVCSSSATAEALVASLLRDDERRQQIGAAARAVIQQHFSPSKVGAQWEELYADVAKTFQGSNARSALPACLTAADQERCSGHEEAPR